MAFIKILSLFYNTIMHSSWLKIKEKVNVPDLLYMSFALLSSVILSRCSQIDVNHKSLNQNKYQLRKQSTWFLGVWLLRRSAQGKWARKSHSWWLMCSKQNQNKLHGYGLDSLLFAMLLLSVLEKYILVVFLWVDDGLFLYIIVKSV